MDKEKVTAVYSVLHLVFHRNKNQHGKTKWWKWLSLLKRATMNLLKSLECELAPSRSKSIVDKHAKHLATSVIPKCYCAFSTVVADGQFSTLGIVLIATLARLTKAMAIDKKLGCPPQKSRVPAIPDRSYTPKEDIGEVLSRTQDHSGAAVDTETPTAHPTALGVRKNSDLERKKRPGSTDVKKPKKIKKTKKDAIDELFAGIS
ncbi:hypothetical protein P168DRAFT_120958 [Aspergillus campestris IBT 28561]|uniref:RNase MRP protein 1 RNA binding domain-containing protein n=1 Tax=Aspergillus campestris (strain IBT 28561) TaxID=1392248 RepID=A0A2I1DAJ9_ASPC2|nr:uncharacterized protein P168DRAFT_120958 [Aspergillus campestris IBT 28561]PKY06899.1 hypothetical protein P168DRAFT_120958 [Aspergillus campestris IBT 28561]